MLAAAVDARKQRKDIQFGFMPAGHGELTALYILNGSTHS
jgi:hypothetical protein